ncbi:MAG TPA: hypothetical protein VIC57_05025 [Candidatus Dormibacteraeota bacterium]
MAAPHRLSPDDIEATLVPRIRAIADQVASRHTDLSVFVEAGPSRQDGYVVAISCILPDRERDEPDLLDLEIRFEGLGSQPMLACADVVWGHPSGHLEAELHRRPRPVDDAIWADLLEALPRLTDALEAGLRRGRPPA